MDIVNLSDKKVDNIESLVFITKKRFILKKKILKYICNAQDIEKNLNLSLYMV